MINLLEPLTKLRDTPTYIYQFIQDMIEGTDKYIRPDIKVFMANFILIVSMVTGNVEFSF